MHAIGNYCSGLVQSCFEEGVAMECLVGAYDFGMCAFRALCLGSPQLAGAVHLSPPNNST